MFEHHELRVTSYLPQEGYGAGGMTVGLTNQGIIVHHIPSGLGVSCDSERSQHANKEKALRLLELILKPVGAPYCGDQYADTIPMYIPERAPMHKTLGHKVNMIKEVREKSGHGLREAKMAVDAVHPQCSSYDMVIEKALKYLGIQQTDYSCALGEWCNCGGDTQGVRQGCYNYTGKQL